MDFLDMSYDLIDGKSDGMMIRKAQFGEAGRILNLYHQLIDKMKGSEYPLRWEKEVYPVLADIQKAINEGAMYVAEKGNCTVGAFIINHLQGDGYRFADWKYKAAKESVAVIHLLATLPEYQGKGLGRKMLDKAVEIARQEKDEVIRLDTLPWNVPGKKLYEKYGFQYCGDVELDYPSTGKISFSMYELKL